MKYSVCLPPIYLPTLCHDGAEELTDVEGGDSLTAQLSEVLSLLLQL